MLFSHLEFLLKIIATNESTSEVVYISNPLRFDEAMIKIHC